MKNQNSSPLTNPMKLVTACVSLLMAGVLFFPIWKIELTAPQYPEGLVLKIFANKLGGNVDIVNGLNHYIGMRTLHADDFIEFTILPYIIGGFAVVGLIILLMNRKRMFYAWTILYLILATVSMVDFYRWEYNYGHELNPDAPIQVPGMAYQPPLIGYKKLLNFGAYSIPDIGGWMFIAAGVLLVGMVVLDIRGSKYARLKGNPAFIILLLLVFASCSSGPHNIEYGKEACDFCKMNIVDEKFAVQCITSKGKVYLFDDTHCLISFIRNGGVWRTELAGVYFSDFNKREHWISSDYVFLLQSDSLHSPMGGNTIAFSSEQERDIAWKLYNGNQMTWKDISPVKVK